MTALSRFARLLGLPAHQAEDALYSERAARAVLTRRSFFAASGAMAAGACFSFGSPSRHTGPQSASGEPGVTGARDMWLDRFGHDLAGLDRIGDESGDSYRERIRRRLGHPKLRGQIYSWADIEIRIDQKLVLPVTEINWS